MDPDYEAVYVGIVSEVKSDFDVVLRREAEIPFGADPRVVTIPIWTGRVRIGIVGIDREDPLDPKPGDPGYIEPESISWTGIAFGEDRLLEVPGWPRLIDKLAPAKVSLAFDGFGVIHAAYEKGVSSKPDGSEIRDHFYATSSDGGKSFHAAKIASEERKQDSLAVSAGGAIFLAHVIGNPSQPALC